MIRTLLASALMVAACVAAPENARAVESTVAVSSAAVVSNDLNSSELNLSAQVTLQERVVDSCWENIPVRSFSIPAEMAEAWQTEMSTGTLLLSQGDCLAVRVFTSSSFTHVAAVVREGETSWVYDSMNGIGVRKLPLADYIQDQSDTIISVLVPTNPWSEQQKSDFVEHLESELGRPYGIKHHLSGKRASGIHCAEYMTDALMTADVIVAEKPSRVSPGSLTEGVIFGKLYAPRYVASIQMQPIVDEQPTGGWFRRSWVSTKRCTLGCCRKMRGWFGCK